MKAENMKSLLSFLHLMGVAVSNATLYAIDHQQVSRLCNQALGILTSILDISPELTILVIDGELIMDGANLGNAFYLNRFGDTLKSHGIGHIKLLRGITVQELKYFISALSGKAEKAGEIRSSDHVRIGNVEVRLAESQLREEGTPGIPLLGQIPEKEREVFAELYRAMSRNAKLGMTGIGEIVAGVAAAFDRGEPVIPFLFDTSGRRRFSHSTTVCVLTILQARALRITGSLLRDIGTAAMLHDIGNMLLPEELLNGKETLDENELRMIREHPIKGARRLMETPGVPGLAVVAAFEHHMHYDFGGYPEVPANWRQNMCSLLVAISDACDSIWGRKREGGVASFDEIMAGMLGLAGTRLDPVLTCGFLQELRKALEPA